MQGQHEIPLSFCSSDINHKHARHIKPDPMVGFGTGRAAMFATSAPKKVLVALLLSGVLIAPAEAKGWKFHVVGFKVELGNNHPVTIRPPGDDHARIITPGIALLDGVGSWFTAPGDIRKAVEKVPTAIVDQGNRFYQLLAETVEWFKGLVTSYGLVVLLGLAATMFLSAITGAFIIGRVVRSGLPANWLNVAKTAA